MIVTVRKTNPQPSARGLTAKEFYEKIKNKRYPPLRSVGKIKKEKK